MLGERDIGAGRPAQNNTRLGHRRGNNLRVIGLLCEALLEKIAIRSPSVQRRLYRLSCSKRCPATGPAWVDTIDTVGHWQRLRRSPRLILACGMHIYGRRGRCQALEGIWGQ